MNEKEFSSIMLKYGQFPQSIKYKLKTAFRKIDQLFWNELIKKCFTLILLYELIF